MRGEHDGQVVVVTGASAGIGRTVAVVALAEVVRALRYLNVPVGLAVAGVPWAAGVPTVGALVITAAGLAVAALSIRRGPVRERYGAWRAGAR